MSDGRSATEFFDKGFSCTQAILAAFGPRFGLDRETGIMIGRAFGSGMGRGLTCGAVTGAFIVLGLQPGAVAGNDRDNRYKTYDRVGEFIRRFEEKRGSIVCRDLLGVDLATQEGQREVREKSLFTRVCPGIVADAEAVLAEMTGV